MKLPAERLILLIAKLGGSASRRNIARAHLTGDALEQAKAETADLVVFEPVYLKRKPKSQKPSRNRSWTARLTGRGIWRAAQLGARFDPELITTVLATIDIKELLSRLCYERNRVWLEIEKDRDDAARYRRLLDDEKRMLSELAKKPVRRKRKMTLRRVQRLNEFLASRGKPAVKMPVQEQSRAYAQPMPPTYEIPGIYQPGGFKGRDDVAPAPILPAHRLPPPPLNPAPSFTVMECPLDGRPVVAPADPVKRASLLDKIQQAGFTVRNGKVLYGGTDWLEPEIWRQKMPHVDL